MEQKKFEEITNIPCETHVVICRYATEDFFVKSRVIQDHELVFVFGGKGLFTVNGKKYEALPGMLFYFYPGLVHQCETTGPKHVQFYGAHFSFHYGNPQARCLLPFAPVNTIPYYAQADIKELFAKLHQTFKQPKQGQTWQCNLLLEQLIYTFASALHPPFINTGSRLRAAQLSQYIEDHFREKINIADLCLEIGVKEATLYRLFQEVWRMSPMDYVTRRRIDEARELLYTENCTVEKVGQMVGIDDPYYFSRLFRKSVGVSPRKYRALFQK